jgi:hypothetical protein
VTALEELVQSLLYEGYALYPYTPEATKNATPTPFGIVYPPAYATESEAAFEHLQVECLLASAAPVAAAVRFLQPSGTRHEAVERRIDLPAPGWWGFSFADLRGFVLLSVSGDRVRVRVENTTDCPSGLNRTDALRRSLVSTHVVLTAGGGRFVSPLEAAGCENVNAWPVLASPADDVILGAAIVLPDHPRIAPESRGSLFDGTEIEEALLLHVHALSEGERDEIAATDGAVRAMIDRAAATTPADLLALHGMMRPAADVLAGFDPRQGEAEAVVDGVALRPGLRVLLRPKHRTADAYDLLLDGKPALVERVYVALDGAVQLAVTVEGDPMREIFRDTGRFLYFYADEVEVVG